MQLLRSAVGQLRRPVTNPTKISAETRHLIADGDVPNFVEKAKAGVAG